MRPERLELAGVGVFRDRTVVDFGGVDLFALSGPTGAGKSTVIDAIVFALYGSVPRYDNKSLVAPVVSQGKVEARVLLDFHVGGERYRVARVVRAGARGATTKEARLERVGAGDPAEVVDVLAGTADEVTAAIERLLGLTYEHFTTCVVLPQGDFQRFLHQRPAQRQDLLVELLDLGIYGRMAALARARATAAAHQRAFVADELAKLAPYSADQRGAIETEIAGLEKLVSLIDDALPAIDEQAARATEASAAARRAAEREAALAGIAVPDGAVELAGALRDATARAVDARAAEDDARAALHEAQLALDACSAAADLEAARLVHETRDTEAARIPKGEQRVAEAQQAEHHARASLAAARDAHRQALQALDAARVADRARELATHLVPGEPCPVCRQVVDAPPAHDGHTALAALAAAEGDAAAAVAEADGRHQAAAATSTRYRSLLADVRQRVAELDEHLAGLPDRAVIDAETARTAGAAAGVEAARRVERDAVAARSSADRLVESLRRDEAGARRRFDRARDAVAALGPPPAEHDDLGADWAALVAWAEQERPSAAAAARTAAADAAAADDEARRLRAELADACAGAGLDVPHGRLARDVAVERLSDARADLDSLDGILARAEELRAADARLADDEAVAAALGTHLRSTGFEKWMLDDVLRRLVAGATGILHELSAGAYSLTFDGRAQFSVIDHANADTARSARTLSGGETFLAALALALALADEVAQLATGAGTVRLESIFLDEGFGTLDPGTLDTVATAIEELGARGRMVGLVTHVRDLAERMPVRYEITREANASTITRVDR